MTSHLLHHGVVHSVTDPYATALLVADGVIAWLGADDSADRVAGPEVERIDLDGAVVAPAFVEPCGIAADARDALTRGTSVVTVLSGRDGASADVTPASGVQTVVYRAADVVDPDAAGVWLPVAADADVDSLAGLLAASTRVGEQVYLVPEDSQGADQDDAARAQSAAVAALRGAADEVGAASLGRVRHRLVVTGTMTDVDRAFLASIAASVTVAPGKDGVLRAPVASLLADAVPVCLGAGPEGCAWAAVRAALAHPVESERVSARSAFVAATRTGLRALPDVPAAAVDAAPRLTVSVPATFAVWSTAAVTVQAADGRVAAWSTDTRAGTPLLPALDVETDLPVLVATWVAGAPHD